MGFEYKLITKITDKQIIEIQYLLEESKFFDKKYEFDNKIYWELRYPENNGKIPNITITFEDDGIYICQWSSSYLWKELETLKNYMESENIKYKIVDYQE